MLRFICCVVTCVFAWTTSATAQGIQSPYVPPVAVPTPILPFHPYLGGIGGGVNFPNGYMSVGFGAHGSFVNPYPNVGWFGIGGYPYAGYGYWNQTLPRAPLTAPYVPLPNLSVSNEPDWLKMSTLQRPAELTIQLPAEGELWQDGKLVAGSGQTRTLSSPSLKPTEKYVFHVKMRWTKEGTTYEAERTTEVKPGESTKLIIFAGTPVAK